MQLVGLHLVAGGWILSMLLFGNIAPDPYRMAMQEDRSIEWATVWLFLMAGVIGLSKAVRQRHLFDGLVALFCLFVAGEEFSWGQRLFGYYPAEFFLGNNFQQEANLHNLPQWFVQPRWVLMCVLGCYGILLPLLARAPGPRALMARVGARSPSTALLPWFAIAIALLLWYPLTFTGEWVELLAGGLFLMAMGPAAPTFWTLLVLAVGFGPLMTMGASALERGRDASRIPCATSEARSLMIDVASGEAGTSKLWRMSRVHKRIWSSVVEGYLEGDELSTFTTTHCADMAADSGGLRHKYGIDPWGSPYWLLVERIGRDERRVTTYSFGPNRRRDIGDTLTNHADNGDDIVATSTKRLRD